MRGVGGTLAQHLLGQQDLLPKLSRLTCVLVQAGSSGAGPALSVQGWAQGAGSWGSLSWRAALHTAARNHSHTQAQSCETQAPEDAPHISGNRIFVTCRGAGSEPHGQACP